jgi:hypothetical protein
MAGSFYLEFSTGDKRWFSGHGYELVRLDERIAVSDEQITELLSLGRKSEFKND